MVELLVATRNNKKREELRALLETFKNIKVLDLNDLKEVMPEIVEDGKTFRQNAVKKAVITSKFFYGLVLADDSGLEVDALGGKPGVRSARFARNKATDEENNQKLIKLLNQVPEKSRKARFISHVAIARKGHLLASFEGVLDGNIVIDPKGKNGFGYDPHFVPDGHEKTLAQMTAAYKNRISHRSIALKEVKKFIYEYLASL